MTAHQPPPERPATPQLAQQLAEEARYLHAALFSRPLSAAVVERYVAAHAALFPEPAPEPMLRKIIARRLDPEAIEFILRHRSPHNSLTTKMQILCYLVEVRAAYFPDFVNTGQSRGGAICELAWSAMLSGWKLLKGKYLIWRHGLL